MDRIKIIATLKWVHDLLQSNGVTEPLEDVDDCIVMLKMEQRASVEQEPVAWMMPEYGDVLPTSQADGTGIYNIPLYTAPPRKEWVGLMFDDYPDEELTNNHFKCGALWAERLLKGKNT